MKKIYILHEYFTPSHFNSLYNDKKKKYLIKDYIIISKLNLLKYCVKKSLKEKKIVSWVKFYFKGLLKIRNIKKQSGVTLIIGVAPYNKLLKKYEKLFKKNNTIYFTSYTHWNKVGYRIHNSLRREEYFKVINNSIDSIAGVSKKTIETIKPYINKNIKCEVVKHSIDVENYLKKDFKTIKNNKIKKIIYLGQFIERKNIKILLEWLNKTNQKVEIHFGGSGILENEIKKSEKKGKNVKLLGKMKKEEIKEKLKEYDYLILPSEDEPYGIVLLEALSAGVPCIVSKADGPKEIIKKGYNGFILEKGISVNELEKNMKKILCLDKVDYLKLVEGALISSKKYTSYEINKKWLNLIFSKGKEND